MSLKDKLWIGFDIGIVLSSENGGAGGSKSQDEEGDNHYKGFISLADTGIGLYLGPNLNAFEEKLVVIFLEK